MEAVAPWLKKRYKWFEQGQTLDNFYDFDFYPRNPLGTSSREEPAVLQSFTLIGFHPSFTRNQNISNKFFRYVNVDLF